MRMSFLGALFLAAAAPLFLVANVVVGLGWEAPGFSWAGNNISDLGNVGCGIWDTTRPRYVCSPRHDLMNAAFLLTSALLVAGLVLRWRVWDAGWGRWLTLAGAAGLGLAGAFPADVDEDMHLLAALLVFFAGNAGLVAVGVAGGDRAALVLGVLGVAGTVAFLGQWGPVVGVGGMERIAVFPLPLWACYAGVRAGRTWWSARTCPVPPPLP